MPGGRISAGYATLRELIRQAYGVDADMIFGGPDWINSARFVVEAKAARADATPSQLQAMLATLLAERFSVKVRREARVRPVFFLTLARSDGRLGPARCVPFCSQPTLSAALAAGSVESLAVAFPLVSAGGTGRFSATAHP